MDFEHTHTKHIHALTYIYMYTYIHIMQKLRNHDGCILLSGFRNDQTPRFDFLTSCPMYLFVPHLPTHNPPHQYPDGLRCLGEWTWNNQREERLQEDSPDELMIIK